MRIYRIVFFFLLLIANVSCYNSFKNMSYKIEEQQRVNRVKNTLLTFYDLRLKLYKTGKLNFLKDADTAFMLEAFSVDDATYYGKIWTLKDSVLYMYRNNEFAYGRQGPFTAYMGHLVTTWDTIAIRENERRYSNIIPEQEIFGVRIIHLKAPSDIRTIKFKMFFNADRDR